MSAQSVALNWLPFETHSGASHRAFELHRRLQGEFSLTAFVTGAFPSDYREALASIRFVEVAAKRTPAGRILEGSALWWRRLVGDGCRLWATDTLPVVRPGGAAAVLTIHDLRHTADRSFSSTRRRLLTNLTLRRSLVRADAVIAVSRWCADRVAEFEPSCAERLTVVPNAAGSLPVVSPGDAAPGHEPFILAVGHLEKRKNLECLIRAFSSISSGWPGRLVLAGSDQGAGRLLVEMAEGLGLGGRVDLAGAVSPGRLAELYSACEILVCPSLYEGFGMTLLEGMTAGRPVVASAIPSHREVAGDAALLVETGEGMETRLAEALRRVLGDAPLRTDLVAKGLARASCFSWDRSAEMLGELYSKLIEPRQGRNG